MLLMDETEVHYRIAEAHQVMLTVSYYIESAGLTSLDYPLSCKESRSDIAPDPITGESRRAAIESLYQTPEHLEKELSGFLDNKR